MNGFPYIETNMSLFLNIFDMLVIGAKEVEEGTVSVRNRAGETVTKSVDAFLAEALLEVAERRR